MTNAVERLALRLLTRGFLAMASTWKVAVLLPDGRRIAPKDYGFGRELFAARERDLLALLPIARYARFVALVAEGKDGDRASFVAGLFGAEAVRGSSLHAPGVAAIRLCRALRERPGPGLLVVDGPVGPAGVAKSGVAAVASLSSRPIRCVALQARPKVTLFYLWSKMIVPMPFARITIALDDELVVPSSGREACIGAAAEVTRRLAGCVSRAEGGEMLRGAQLAERERAAR